MEKTRQARSEGNSRTASVASESDIRPVEDAVNYLRDYARQQPEMAALWCFGIGFVLGWKLKPW